MCWETLLMFHYIMIVHCCCLRGIVKCALTCALTSTGRFCTLCQSIGEIYQIIPKTIPFQVSITIFEKVVKFYKWNIVLKCVQFVLNRPVCNFVWLHIYIELLYISRFDLTCKYLLIVLKHWEFDHKF